MTTAPATNGQAQLGPNTRRALVLPVEGTKRRKVLVLIAAYADAGRDDPAISELSQRSGLTYRQVVFVVDRLEADGWLEVRRSHQRRNRYRLLGVGR
ncbi:MAG TPA: hypothetical protein VFI09_00920 [Solirubrobacterales bacterium]|nr:hypothetical protein [Solirubrobacterales bacterium]